MYVNARHATAGPNFFFSISGSRIAELEMHLLAAKVNGAQSIQYIADQDQTVILVWKKIIKRKKK